MFILRTRKLGGWLWQLWSSLVERSADSCPAIPIVGPNSNCLKPPIILILDSSHSSQWRPPPKEWQRVTLSVMVITPTFTWSGPQSSHPFLQKKNSVGQIYEVKLEEWSQSHKFQGLHSFYNGLKVVQKKHYFSFNSFGISFRILWQLVKCPRILENSR